MPVYCCVLTVHDFFFYVSRESRVGFSLPYIHNTALLYALGRTISATQRVVAGTSPFYEEDMVRFTTYATPAFLLPDRTGRLPEPVRISYNAIDSPLVFSMEKEQLLRGSKTVIPKFSAYFRYLPGTRFLFYAVGAQPPPLVRVGKKLIPARVEATRVEAEFHPQGRFRAAHPVNPLDLPTATRLEAGDLITIPPVPLVERAELSGAHFTITGNDQTWHIACPDWNRFRGVQREEVPG